MANLIMALYDSGRTMFTTTEAAQITGLTVAIASSLLHRARKRGLFVIVPPELGSSVEYSGNPYLVARYLASDAAYFLSHQRVGTSPHGDAAAACHIRLQHQTHSQPNAARKPIPFCSPEGHG